MIKICDICENLYMSVDKKDQETADLKVCSIFENLCQRCNIIMHHIDVCEYHDNKVEVIAKFEQFSDHDKITDNFINFAETET